MALSRSKGQQQTSSKPRKRRRGKSDRTGLRGLGLRTMWSRLGRVRPKRANDNAAQSVQTEFEILQALPANNHEQTVSDSGVPVANQVGKISRMAVFPRLLGEPIQSASDDIFFQLLVPLSRIIFGEPGTKHRFVQVRKLPNGFLNFLHSAHTARLSIELENFKRRPASNEF